MFVVCVQRRRSHHNNTDDADGMGWGGMGWGIDMCLALLGRVFAFLACWTCHAEPSRVEGEVS